MAFEAVYGHEVKVTGLIYNLANIATEQKDHATSNFLQWFITEQVEEETSADSIVQKLKLIGSEGGGLYMLDQELAQRVFTPCPGLPSWLAPAKAGRDPIRTRIAMAKRGRGVTPVPAHAIKWRWDRLQDLDSPPARR